MHITDLQLKQFRCFESLHLTFNSPIVLIEGANGSGKTSLLEALYYAGHLHSFKASTPKEMIYHLEDSFFVKVAGVSEESWNIQTGYSQQKKNIKINESPVKTYKDLYATYRAISITEDDMALVQGSPETRRSFLDHGLSFISLEYRTLHKRYKRVLEQRNALLSQPFVSGESYALWTEQLDELTTLIQEQRIKLLASLELIVNRLLDEHFAREALPYVTLSYSAKRVLDEGLKIDELRAKKTLFGAHLDDFSFLLGTMPAKVFASRGQQKLLTVLIKIAVGIQDNQSHVLLLDDFVTDFDEARLSSLVRLLQAINAQIFFTIPVQKSALHDILSEYPHQIITLLGAPSANSTLK